MYDCFLEQDEKCCQQEQAMKYTECYSLTQPANITKPRYWAYFTQSIEDREKVQDKVQRWLWPLRDIWMHLEFGAGSVTDV